ncbi:hypothetical protein L9F63_015333, partial [Diploptera punctata]
KKEFCAMRPNIIIYILAFLGLNDLFFFACSFLIISPNIIRILIGWDGLGL